MALVITITISDYQEKCLKYKLLDIEEWLQGDVDGKINKCTIGLLREAMVKLKADQDITSIPTDDQEIIDIYTAKPYYLDRTERVAKTKADAEERNKS